MPLPPSAPYDSLATVTQMTRTALADFIQNIQPNNSGTVNTSGINVTWVSGNQFNANMNGVAIVINGVANTVSMVTSPTTLTVVNAVATLTGAAYSLTIPTGDIFSDSQSYTLPVINQAWRKLLDKLDAASHPKLRNEVIISTLPVAGTLDPASQQYINWTNFYDGANLTTTPTLPADFVTPLRLWERQSVAGSSPTNPNLNGFVPMYQATDGLPNSQKGSWNGYWDWKEDALYFIGSILQMDIRIMYKRYLPDIAVSSTFASTPIPIMRCARALSFYAAAIFVEPRGGAALAPSFYAKGDESVDIINNTQAKILQRGSFRRRAVYDSSGQFVRTRARWQ